MLICILHLIGYLISLNGKHLIRLLKKKQVSVIFKALNNLTPAYITNLFKPACEYISLFKTSDKLHVPAAYHKSVRFNGAKISNFPFGIARKATT